MGKKRNAETANKCKDTGKSRDKVREFWTVISRWQNKTQGFKVSLWHNQIVFYKDHDDKFVEGRPEGAQEWRQGKLGS